MFNSYNSHIVTRAHSSIVDQLIAGEITPIVGADKLNAFEINEAHTENYIHDTMLSASGAMTEYEYESYMEDLKSGLARPGRYAMYADEEVAEAMAEAEAAENAVPDYAIDRDPSEEDLGYEDEGYVSKPYERDLDDPYNYN